MDGPISRIRKAPEMLHRYQQILTILGRYGLAQWLDRIPLGFAREIVSKGVGEDVVELSTEGRVRHALGDLGPIFIKLGQLLSNRPDIVGTELAKELQYLQDRAPTDSSEQARTVLEESLPGSVEQHFTEVQWEPIASASIAQVHLARLVTGQKVAVKIQHHDLERIVRTDLTILSDLAELLEHYVQESRVFRPVSMVEEFRRVLMRELDFQRELHHIQAFRRNFKDDPVLCIPEPYPEHTSSEVLTMQWLEGVKFNDEEALKQSRVDKGEIAQQGARVFLDMIFEHGLFHGDPHPGNFLLLNDRRIGLLDYGQIGRVDDDLRQDLEEILLGVTQKDPRRIMHVLTRMGAAPTDLDRSRFQSELNALLAYYSDIPLGQLNVAAAIKELFDLLRRHQIVLPADLSLLLTVVISLEGTGRGLDPDFRLMDLLMPYQHRIAMRRFSPARQMRRVMKIGQDLERLMETAPAAMSEVARQLEDGKFTLQLRVEEIDKARHQVEQSTNRLTFGILTASIILASSLLLINNVPPTIGGYSAIGLVGYLISVFLALRLIWAIYRSGKLN